MLGSVTVGRPVRALNTLQCIRNIPSRNLATSSMNTAVRNPSLDADAVSVIVHNPHTTAQLKAITRCSSIMIHQVRANKQQKTNSWRSRSTRPRGALLLLLLSPPAWCVARTPIGRSCLLAPIASAAFVLSFHAALFHLHVLRRAAPRAARRRHRVCPRSTLCNRRGVGRRISRR